MMDRIANVHQAVAWNGYEGWHWAQHHERYNAANESVNERLFAAAAIGPDDRVLDLGCGTGQTTRIAARHAHTGHATGLDLSAPMLERAESLTAEAGLTNVTFVRGDAQVFPFAPGAFDVAISRFGVMFYADPVAAFGNVRRAVRPGGRLAFVCLGAMDEDNELTVPFRALAGHVPPATTPADDQSSPDSLADPERTRAILVAAGFADVRTELLEAPMTFGADAEDAAAFLIGWGPVQHRLREAGIIEPEPVRSAIAAALRPYETDRGVVLRSDNWLVTAAQPASV